MSVQWNNWISAAENTPKAGQLQTKGDQVVRNKRAWGSHKLSTQALDERRSLKDMRLNQDTLGDVYTSLKNEFGGPTADIVYGQIFEKKFDNGRPISSGDILVANALAKNILAAQDHLIRSDHHYGTQIVLDAFSVAFSDSLINDDGKITNEALSDRLAYAHQLAKSMLLRDQIEHHQKELVETAAALPSQERREFIQSLKDKINTNEEVAETEPLAADNSNAWFHKQENLRRDHQIALNADRRATLEKLIPSAQTLADLDKIDKTITQYAALTDGLERVKTEIQDAQYELATAELDLTNLSLDLPKHQAEAKSIEQKIELALQESAKLQLDKKTVFDTELSPLESDLAVNELNASTHQELLDASEKVVAAESRTLSHLTGDAVPAGETKVVAAKLAQDIAAQALAK